MDTVIREFARQMLRKLQSRPSQPRPTFKEPHAERQEPLNGDITETPAEQVAHPIKDKLEEDEAMEDGQLPADDLAHTPYLPERIELPADKAHVLQHVELLFALSVKVPEFLDE